MDSCFIGDFDYTFTYNGVSYHTDNCYTQFGVATCRFDGITYNNVSYTSSLVNCRVTFSELINFSCILLMFFIIPYLLFYFFKFFIGR